MLKCTRNEQAIPEAGNSAVQLASENQVLLEVPSSFSWCCSKARPTFTCFVLGLPPAPPQIVTQTQLGANRLRSNP